MSTTSDRLATLQKRLTGVQAAIDGTLTRGVAGYTDAIGNSLSSMRLTDLRQEERAIINQIARLQRGSRFGKVGFVRPT